MRSLTLSIVAAVFASLSALAQPVAYKEVKLYPPVEGLGDSVEMALQVLKPEVVFFGDKTIQGDPPPWALAKLAALNLTPEDIPKRFTPEYLSEYGMPKLGRTPPEVYSSVTHGLFVRHKGSEYVSVSGSFSPDRGKLATEPSGYGTSVLTAEGWKRTALPKWTIAFPMNNVEKLQAILDRGAAQMVQGEMEAAPEPRSSSGTSSSSDTDTNASPSSAP